MLASARQWTGSHCFLQQILTTDQIAGIAKQGFGAVGFAVRGVEFQRLVRRGQAYGAMSGGVCRIRVD